MTTPGGLLLRLAVVVGAASLVAGIAGMVLLAIRPDLPPSGTGTPTTGQVRVRGDAARSGDQQVEVEWVEDGARITQAARRGEAPGVWVLPPLPEGHAITLRLRRVGDGAVLHQIVYDTGLPPDVEVVVDEGSE